MSNLTLFKQNSSKENLDEPLVQAAVAWDKFQRIEKTAKPARIQPTPEETAALAQAVKRYANSILSYTDPTAIESVINVAFSNLDTDSLKKLGKYLHQNLLDKQADVEIASAKTQL